MFREYARYGVVFVLLGWSGRGGAGRGDRNVDDCSKRSTDVAPAVVEGAGERTVKSDWKPSGGG